MKIKHKDWIIEVEKYQFIVSQTKTKEKGGTYQSGYVYLGSIEKVVKHIIHKSLSDIEGNYSLQEFLSIYRKEISKLEKLLK